MQECKYVSILSSNVFDPNLTWPKVFQTKRTRRLAHLPSFCELVLYCFSAKYFHSFNFFQSLLSLHHYILVFIWNVSAGTWKTAKTRRASPAAVKRFKSTPNSSSAAMAVLFIAVNTESVQLHTTILHSSPIWFWPKAVIQIYLSWVSLCQSVKK